MRSHFYHIQVNIDFANLQFYKDLFAFLGWSVIFAVEDVIGFKSDTTGDIWLVNVHKAPQANYDAKGVNHISIRVDRQENVDEVKEFLRKKKIPALFDTPRHRPEFSSPQETYYQVMFKTIDNILFEIVYIGPKDEK